MELTFQLVVLVVGLVLLWKMGALCVRNALGFSAIYGIHQFSVGFFIFALSTGLPEISSAVVSSLNKVPQLSVGDLIGSALVNISLILGLIIMISKTIEVSPHLKNKLLKALGLIFLLLSAFLFLKSGGLWLGVVLIALYLGSIYWFQAGLPKTETAAEIKTIEKKTEKIEKKPIITPKVDILAKLLGSLGLLLLSSWITVHAAAKLAALMQVQLALLGGTIVAVGTSFPELVLSIHAIRRKEYALALGDLFGASLLNISLTLGFLIIMNPGLSLGYAWKVTPFVGAILIWVAQAFARKKSFNLKDGLFFLSVFFCYFGWSLFTYTQTTSKIGF